MGAWDLLWEEPLSSSGEKIHNSSKRKFVFFSFFFLQSNHNLSLQRRGILNAMISLNCIISWGRLTTSPWNSFPVSRMTFRTTVFRKMPRESSAHSIAPCSAASASHKFCLCKGCPVRYFPNKHAVHRRITTSLEVCVAGCAVHMPCW